MKIFSLIGLGLLAGQAVFGKLNVVATTADLGALAEQVGGDQVEVFTIARATEDPHFVDPKPSYVVKLNRADVLIEGGADLEIGWLPALLDKARNNRIAAGQPGRIVASEGVALLEIPTALDRSKGDLHAAGNPHYTSDPLNARIVANHIAAAFSQLRPKAAASFQANAKKIAGQIDAGLPKWSTALAPLKGKRLTSYHNAWPYFGRRFDLRIDLFLEPKPGIPPSAAHLAQVITTMQADQVKLILVEPYRDRRWAETAAKHAQATVVDVPFYPGSKGAGESYVEWMDRLVNAISHAFAEAR